MNEPITINGRPLAVCWGSNSPLTPGGYGQQTRLITRSLRDQLGISIAVSASYGQMNGKLIVDGIDVYPQAYKPYGNDIHAANAKQHGADLLLTHQDVPWQDPRALSAGGMRWASWFPVDHTPLSRHIVDRLTPDFCYQPLVLSHFGQAQAEAAGLDVRLIPQAIDTAVFVPGDRTAARAALGWPKDAFIVGMVAQNRGYPDRKAYPEQIRAFRTFAQRHTDALIYIHAFGNDELDPEARTDIPGHLGAMARRALWAHPYDLNMGYQQSDMVLRYQAFDVLLSVSMAEGFGLPLIEAQSCGVPVITGDWSATGENCYAGWKVALADSEPWYVTPYGADCQWRLPHIGAIEELLEDAYDCLQSEAYRTHFAVTGRACIVANHDQATITDTYWRAALTELAQRIEAEPIPYHRHKWAAYGHQNGRGVIQPCLVPDCPAERADPAGTIAPMGFPLLIDGIELDIEDDPNGGQRYAIADEITKVYRLHELTFEPGDVVIDVGAHVGIVSCYLAKKWPNIEVYAFEPVPANHDRLRRNLRANGCLSVWHACVAITADGQCATLYGSPDVNTGHYSAYDSGPVAVEAKGLSLRDLLEQTTIGGHSIDRIALLKLDCEGAEYEIIYGLHQAISRIDALVMEVHENESLTAEHGSGSRLIEYARQFIPYVRASVITIPDAQGVMA